MASVHEKKNKIRSKAGGKHRPKSANATAALKGKKKTKKQAPALSEQDWDSWCDFIKATHSCRLYVLIQLTCMFALRCGEAAMLTGEDFDLENSPASLRIPSEEGRNKSPGSIPILPEQVELIKLWRTEGVCSSIEKKTNKTHKMTYPDHFVLPSGGRCFKSRGTYGGEVMEQDHLSYHAVWAAVRGLANKMAKSDPSKFAQWSRSCRTVGEQQRSPS